MILILVQKIILIIIVILIIIIIIIIRFNYAFGPHFGVKISKWYPKF